MSFLRREPWLRYGYGGSEIFVARKSDFFLERSSCILIYVLDPVLRV